MTTATCPDEDALFSLVAGDADPDTLAHAEGCPICRKRIEGMRVGLNTLRNLFTHETITGEAPAPAMPASRPAQIGKYFIVGSLGEGAQAIVYRGLHITLNKEVVLKVGRHPVENGDLDRAHLVNEGKVLAMLDHPHLAKVLDLDFHEGRPFLVIEYVEGVHLEDYVAAEKLTPRQCAGMVAKLASALAVAHREGVVHHDIKPTNVLVDADGRPILIDFGLAWLRQCTGKGKRREEETCAPGGTLAYMSPEHARGEVEKIGSASDIFALGGVLLFLLTGKPPFSGPDGFTVQQKAMRCDLDTSALDRPHIPRPLAALCRQALSAFPKDRPSSAAVFATELEKLAQPPVKKPYWLLLLGLALAGAACVLGLAAWLWSAPAVLPPAPGVQPLIRLYERTEWGKTKQFTRPTLPAYLTGGDLVAVFFEVPHDSEVALFWLGSSGTLAQREPVVVGEGKTGPRMRYPRDKTVPVTGDSGTEMVLVVANRKGRPLPTLDEMKQFFAEVGGEKPLPTLRPGDPPLLIYRDGIEDGIGERDIGEEVDTPLTLARQRLETLRQKLRKRHDWFWGVALPHR